MRDAEGAAIPVPEMRAELRERALPGLLPGEAQGREIALRGGRRRAAAELAGEPGAGLFVEL